MSVKLFHFIICEMSIVSIVSALRSYKNKIITFKVIQYIFHNIRNDFDHTLLLIFILPKSIINNKNKAFKEITVTITNNISIYTVIVLKYTICDA